MYFSFLARQKKYTNNALAKYAKKTNTHRLGPFSSWPAMRRETPKGRDCTKEYHTSESIKE
jgi:hypothetical protein